MFIAPRKPERRLPRLYQLLNVEIKGAALKERGRQLLTRKTESCQPTPAKMATNPKARTNFTKP